MKKTILCVAAAFVSTLTFAITPLHITVSSNHIAAGTTSSGQCIFPDGTGTGVPGFHCNTPAQFNRAYGIDTLQQMGITGRGQTIILIDAFGSPTLQRDLNVFSDTFGLPRTTVRYIYPNGFFVNPMRTADQQNWAFETSLDVQMAHAVAPQATLVNLVTNNDNGWVNGLYSVFVGLQMAIKAYPNAIVSMSFYVNEPDFTLADVNTFLLGVFHNILTNGSAVGMTFLSASGDVGSTGYNVNGSSLLSFPNIGYPASEPNVTAVGGTWLQAGWRWAPIGTAVDFWNCNLANLAYCYSNFLNYVITPNRVSESVWKEDYLPSATGGGASSIFTMPTFQRNIGSNNLALLGGRRGIPDTAMNAAVNGGIVEFTSFSAPALGVSGPTWSSGGGTSAASPAMAGLVALAGHLASSRLGKNVSVGYLNPILYQLTPANFNDIVPQLFGVRNQVVLQNNILFWDLDVRNILGPLVVAPVPVPGYPTTTGYDLTTGRGSPNAVNFVYSVGNAVVVKNKK